MISASTKLNVEPCHDGQHDDVVEPDPTLLQGDQLPSDDQSEDHHLGELATQRV